MARILALDYGKKRTGIAVTDPLQIVANGLPTIETNQLMAFLENYLASEVVEKIVIGQAFHADGTPAGEEGMIRAFIVKLKKQFPNLQIDRQEESFTSQEAKRILAVSGKPKMKRREKGALDKISAVLILQQYLGHLDEY
jgi:putative Holliday junction resolvase